MNKESTKLFFVLAGLYIAAGVIIFPAWYINVLQGGGILYLVHLAQTQFLVWNIIAMIFISAIVFTVHQLKEKNAELYSKFSKLFKGGSLVIGFWLVGILLAYRLFSHTTKFREVEIDSLAEKVAELEKKGQKSPFIPKVIEPVFIDTGKINQIYIQIAPSMEIMGKSITKKNGVEGEIAAGSKEILSASGKVRNENEQKEDYQKRSLDITEKLSKVINYYEEVKELSSVLPISIESQDLTKFEESISILERYEIKVPKQKVASIKDKIKNEEIRKKITDGYGTNAFVLISGPIKVNRSEKHLVFEFEYVPGNENGVIFSCEVPTSKISESDLDLFKANSQWDLKIFGKILNKNTETKTSYLINCLSVFR